MSRHFVLLSLLLALALPLSAAAVYELTDDMTLSLSGDLRVRLEGFNSGVIFPSAGKSDADATYLRVRTRLAGKLELPDGIRIQARLANRVHKVSSHFLSHPNDVKGETWRFPDEVILDQLFIHFDSIAGSDFSLTLGRQDLILGNGMIMCEGTPFDQGRGLYQDGVVLRYKDEEDTVTGFVFYNQWKDRSVFINDQNRRLRVGDTLSSGVYWTHNFNKELNFDLYYIFNDVYDDQMKGIRAHNRDNNLSLHTVGGRLFGSLLDEQLDYSLEMARQAGQSSRDKDPIEAYMLDARLRAHAPKGTLLSPSLGLEYYYASGDDPHTRKFEGWNTLLAEYPRWGDELLPIMLNGVWSNMHFVRSDINLVYSKDLKGNFSVGNLYADETDRDARIPLTRSGGGSYMGTLLSVMLDYRASDMLSFAAKLSKFKPGSYFRDGKSGYWCQLQAMLEF